MRLEDWFIKIIERPLLIFIALISIFQILYLVHNLKSQNIQIEEEITQLSQAGLLGVKEKNRSLLEFTLSSSIYKYNAKVAMLCDGDVPVLRLGTSAEGTISCGSANTQTMFLSNIIQIPLVGMPNYKFIYLISIIPQLLNSLVHILFTLFIFIFLFVFSRFLKKVIRKDIVLPTLCVMSRSDHNPEIIKIDEIKNMYFDEHEKNKLEKERQLSEALIQQAQQVAHDIKSPLVALKISLNHIESSVPESLRLMARGSLQRIEDIVNVLSLKKNQINQGENSIQLVLKNTLLLNLLEEIVSEKRMQYRSKANISINFNLTNLSYGLFSNVDIRELKRVISNLINNSIEAFDISSKGSVDVVLESVDLRNNIIKVKDNGKGIPSSMMNKLFERGETFGKVGGSGLGLYYAKNIIEKLGGKIAIDSIQGVGTTVSIILPRQSEPDWYLPRIDLYLGQSLVVVDDDKSIHDVWDSRLRDINKNAINVNIVHLTSVLEFEDWYRIHKTKSTDHFLFLFDYEFIDENKTGLDLIINNHIENNSVIVSSRVEELECSPQRKKCGVKIISKALASILPINYHDSLHIKNETTDYVEHVNHVDTVDKEDNMENADHKIYSIVHCDDDQYLRMSWLLHYSDRMNGSIGSIGNKDLSSTFLSISSPSEFERKKTDVSKDAIFYIDHDLGDDEITGLQWAEQLYEDGFKNLYLSTGHDKSMFAEVRFLKGIVGKEPVVL